MSKVSGFSRRAVVASAAVGALLGAGCATAQPGGPAIHVRTVGDGARTWLLIHPFGTSGRFWEARAAALAGAQSVRVVSPDMPSHGQSRIVQRYDYGMARDAIEAAIAPWRDSIELICGASSGGIVALRLAARMGCPVAAIGVGAAFSAKNVADMRAFSETLPEETEQFIAAFLEQGPSQRAAIQRHFGDLATLGQAPLLEATETAALAGRTLIINGDADDFFAPDAAHALARSIPQSSLTFVTDAGHLEPLAAQHRALTWGSIAALAAAHRQPA